MIARLSSAFIVTILLVACGDVPSGPPEVISVPAPVQTAELTETDRLNVWLDEQYEQQLDFSPQTRSVLGDKTDYDQLNDVTLVAQQQRLDWRRQSVAAMRSEFDYQALNDDGKLSFDMWEYALEQAEAAYPYRNYGYIFGRGGPHASLPSFMISFHSVDDESDLEAYLSRLEQIDRVLNDLLNLSKEQADAGIRQPRFNYEFALEEINRVTTGVPFNSNDSSPNSPIWTDFQGKVDQLVKMARLDEQAAQTYLQRARVILSGEVLAAYQEVRAWLEDDMAFAADQAQGVWALPDGENYYNQRLSRMTTLDLTADDIHSIGLAEVDRLLLEMESVKQQTDFEGTLQEFFVFVREDEQFYYPNTDEGRQEYLKVNNEYLNFIFDRLPDYFGRLPKAPLVVKRVESFREQPGAAQHYRQGAPDGSRPGVFYSHMSDMSTLAKWQIEDIAYHEGNPGHHMQISIQQELTDVPRFRTQYRTTAYTEGWGLYSEWLAKEMGGFQDPYSDFGRLAGEIWRAVRLVVDTGIHAKRWSEAQAVQYFLDNSPIPEGAVRSEVKRYFSNPGQATAYKIGMLNFQQARTRAENVLGQSFDVRAFHDVILGSGAVPMPIMHARVESWIKEQLVASPAGQEGVL
ncbi:MAG: DUF885 domain-containing protein [Gammaproteobacteria bacterium]|nr:DUF885 domain-containing protein [Gammaproteobacteria bacterium]